MNKLTLLLIAALPALAAAQEAPRLRLDSYLAEVRANNPEIAAAAALAGAYSEKVKQAWLPMDPVVEFERMYADGALGSGAAERNILIRQEFRNPYKYKLQKSAAKAESEAYGALRGDKANKVLAEARAAYYDYALLWRTERIYAENLDLLKRFATIAETRYAVNQGTQGDAIKAQVELSKALNLLITAQQEKETAAARLNALRNKPQETELAEPEDSVVKTSSADYKSLEAAALAKNPYLAAMAARVKAAEKRVSLGKAEYAPDFMLSWRRRGSDDPAMDGTYDVSLGLTVPLWYGKTSAMGREAKAERDMAAAEYAAARNALLLELKEASVKLNYYARLTELYSGTVLPQAEQSLKAAEAGYQAGKTDFLDLVDSNRTLLETRREFYEYSAGYAGWLGRIKSLTGEGL
ncbi:MAG: TolC family protein [Elusimicrobia bacterium]|nr:TolC family protein [Elusimicrobiota bacterium]